MRTDIDVRVGSEVLLDVARQIEHTVGLCRSLLDHLAHGPYPRTRRRVRKQVRKLAQVLDRVELAALTAPLPGALEDVVRGSLVVVDPRLERTLYHDATKDELRDLRRLLKRVRRELEAEARLPEIAAK